MFHLNLPLGVQQRLHLRDVPGNAQGDFPLLPQGRDLLRELFCPCFQRRFFLRRFDPAQPKPQGVALLLQF